MVTIGICAILRNEARYLREWISFHSLQGVSQFRLYDNASSDRSRAVLRSAQNCNLTVIDWSYLDEGFDDLQRRAYLHGALNLAGIVDFVAFIDADEFLFARSNRGLPEALGGFDAGVGAVAVNQRIFGSAGLRRRRNEYVTARFLKSTTLDDPECRWVKTIARPECVDSFDTVHTVRLKSGRYVLGDGSPFAPEVVHPGCAARIPPPQEVALHHYILKSKQEYETKRIKWSVTRLAGRYDNKYFSERDAVANAVKCNDLYALRRGIDARICRIWPHTRFGVQLRRFANEARTLTFGSCA